jgi:hypothetical protein
MLKYAYNFWSTSGKFATSERKIYWLRSKIMKVKKNIKMNYTYTQKHVCFLFPLAAKASQNPYFFRPAISLYGTRKGVILNKVGR